VKISASRRSVGRGFRGLRVTGRAQRVTGPPNYSVPGAAQTKAGERIARRLILAHPLLSAHNPLHVRLLSFSVAARSPAVVAYRGSRSLP
jgi:hypothetical protein